MFAYLLFFADNVIIECVLHCSAAPVVTRTPRRAKQPVISDDDDEFVNDGDEEEAEEEDFEDEEPVVKKRGKKRRSGRSTRRSRRARDSDSDEAVPKRRPRAASLKKPKYSEWPFSSSNTRWFKTVSLKQLSGQCSLLHQFVLAGSQAHSYTLDKLQLCGIEGQW